MAARFLREDVNTGSNFRIRLVCKIICSRRFKRDHYWSFLSARLALESEETKKAKSNFQLESLILAQNERWRQA